MKCDFAWFQSKIVPSVRSTKPYWKRNIIGSFHPLHPQVVLEFFVDFRSPAYLYACITKTTQTDLYEPHYLFNIEDDEVFYSCYCREKWWKEGSNPANSLPINDFQDIARNFKFLISKKLNQLPRAMSN